MSYDVQMKELENKEILKTELGLSNPAYASSNNNIVNPKSTVVSIDDIDPSFTKETDHEEIPPPEGVGLKIHQVVTKVSDVTSSHKRAIKWIVLGSLLCLYFVYFGFVIAYDPSLSSEGAQRVVWVTCLVVACVLISIFWHFCGGRIEECLEPCTDTWEEKKIGRKLLWIVLIMIYLAVITFIFVDVFYLSYQPYNLVSLGGLLCLVLLCFIFSYSPAHLYYYADYSFDSSHNMYFDFLSRLGSQFQTVMCASINEPQNNDKVNWRAVLWGVALQFIMALIVLRWTWGYNAFFWLGERVAGFLAHADAGSEFVFGSVFREHFFAFAVLPVVVYFSTIISILYYLGAMQWVIQKVSWVLQSLMGTTAGESLNAAGNIFIGQSEAPLMIRPLLPDMTRSEIHAVMTGGFATIAGSVLAAYILFGVPANHLISASVMSAPAALAMAKLFYPETQVSKTTAEDVKHMEKGKERNLIEAASNGASQSIKLVANIAANLIAFIALLHFINSTLTWLGHRVGWYNEPLTFELICSYVFYPLAVVMGTDLQNCRVVAELIGVKTFLNEFVAYDRLGVFIKNKEKLASHLSSNGTYTVLQNSSIVLFDYYDKKDEKWFNQTMLQRGILTDRSEVISTYALCGFANIGSMGIMLGALGSLAPNRKSDLARVVLRAMIAGNVACFMTACVAGLFYQPSDSVFSNYNWDEVLSVTM